MACCRLKSIAVRLRQNHPELGEIRGILAIGLDYSIYLANGAVIIVNAEENPGEIFGSQYTVSQWCFDVQINIIEKTGLTALERLTPSQWKAQQQERIQRYKKLLGEQ